MTLLQKPQLGPWDLSDLVKEKNNDLKSYIKALNHDVEIFENNRQILKDSISSKEFSNLLLDLEKISEKLNMLIGFSHLKYSSNTSSNEFSALVTEMEL